MRVIAWFILILPGIIAGVGIKWMRDAFFNQQYFPYLWMQFMAGLLAFGVGMVFIGGFIFYRERKKHHLEHQHKKER